MSSTSSISTEIAAAADVATLPRAGWLGRAFSRAANLAVRKGTLSVFDQGLVSGTSFVTSVIIGRMCSQSELGIYYLALSVVLFIRAVQSDVVSAPYMIYCHRHKGDSLDKYSGSALMHQLLLTALALMGLGGLLVAVAGGVGPAGMLPAVCVLLGVVPFLLLREFIRNFSFSHLRMGAAVGTDLFISVVQLGSLGWLAYQGELTVPRVYLVMGVSCALACGGWFLKREHTFRIDRRRVRSDWGQNWTFAKWALSGQLLSRAAGYLLPWIIALIHGEASTGVLAACITLVNLAGTFVTGVSNFLTPRAAKAFATGGVTELRDVLAKAALVFGASVGLFFLVMLTAGDFAVTLVYGASFSGAGPILAILAFGMLANSLGLTAGNGLWALDRARSNFLADICNLVVTFAVLICLVGPLGILGAALATTAGFVVGAIARWLTLLRVMAAVRSETARALAAES